MTYDSTIGMFLMKCTVYAGPSETDYKQNGGTKDVEIHNPSRRHDVRYVREPCERCGAESLSGEEGYDVGEIRKESWQKKGLFGR